jgi:uncharacterized protein (TIGR03067 family)
VKTERTSMRQTLLGVCTIFFLVAADDAKQDTQKELERLKGTWRVVSMIQNGKVNEKGPEHSITFDGNNVTIKEPNGESKGTCKIDPTKDPKQIDLIPDDNPDKKLQAIYQLKADELKLCIARDVERPTRFESKEGSRHRYVVLKREK